LEQLGRQRHLRCASQAQSRARPKLDDQFDWRLGWLGHFNLHKTRASA
jgi:hypothetical protein